MRNDCSIRFVRVVIIENLSDSSRICEASVRTDYNRFVMLFVEKPRQIVVYNNLVGLFLTFLLKTVQQNKKLLFRVCTNS